jgi:hypothetical protein
MGVTLKMLNTINNKISLKMNTEGQKVEPTKLVNPCKTLNDEALHCATTKSRKEVWIRL